MVLNIVDGVIVPKDSIVMTRDIEACYLSGGRQFPVRVLRFNAADLLARMEDGQIVAVIATYHPDHGRLCGTERRFRFAQAARTWFYGHVGTAEK